jgi:hypothetical protein
MASDSLQSTINWALTFIQYSPLQAGLGNEPAVSIASMIRGSLFNAGIGPWFFNRNSTTLNLTATAQDYTATIPDFGFIEKCTVVDDQGNAKELKDVYNNKPLSVNSEQARPAAISVESNDGATQSFRFSAIPDRTYTATVIYQKKAQPFGPYFISSVAAAVSGNTTYTGVFDPLSFPTGATAVITGFNQAVNNGSFVVVSSSANTLVVANAAGVVEADITGYAANFSWAPVPDYYRDIYNNLFLSEAMALVDDARAQIYRARGVAAFLAKAQGLSDTQKNVFVQQWLARTSESMINSLSVQQGVGARGQ